MTVTVRDETKPELGEVDILHPLHFGEAFGLMNPTANERDVIFRVTGADAEECAYAIFDLLGNEGDPSDEDVSGATPAMWERVSEKAKRINTPEWRTHCEALVRENRLNGRPDLEGVREL